MDTNDSADAIQRAIELARDCVKRAEPLQALAHLNTVRLEVEDRPRTPDWVEHALIYAGVLGAMRDDGARAAARDAYRDALKRLSELPSPPIPLVMRVHDDYGKYLGEIGAFPEAIDHTEVARKIAESLHASEDVARLEMRVIGLDLRKTTDSLLADFQNLRNAAKEDGYTQVEQLETWIRHSNEIKVNDRFLMNARKRGEASKDYFRGKLSEVRKHLRELVH